jgi:hypothetical protein
MPSPLSGWSRLDQLEVEPPTTPDEWCAQRPCLHFGDLVVNEPLGSLLVFGLALLWLAAGLHLLRSAGGHRSRAWLGVALLLGGAGALQAGISYQAFSYALKCAGRAHCLLTNGFEVGYSVTQAASVSAMLVAVAHACARGAWRRALIAYAWVNAAVYGGVALAGVRLPSRVLLSFEVLMLFALPGLLLVIGVAARRLRASGEALARSLLHAALGMLAVQGAYFAYAAAGITQRLWDGGQGFYFSENDVLHVGMIGWLAYLVAKVGPRLHDAEERGARF